MRKKINGELKIGFSISSFFLFWGAAWLFYYFFLMEGSSIKMDITKELVPPFSGGLILGSDIFGRSVLEVLSSGLIYSLGISLSVNLLSASIGIFIGYLSSSESKKIGMLFDTFTNIIFVFPSILIAIIFMSFVGQSFWGLVAVLVFTGWPGYAKIAKGEIKRVMSLSYVESARSIGITKTRLFLMVLIPGILPVILIHFILGISGVIISESALGFLGLGGSEYSWGALLSISKSVLLEAPFLTVIISITMALLIIGLNLLGDGLRDYLDPHED